LTTLERPAAAPPVARAPKRRSIASTRRWSALFLSPALLIIGVFTLIPTLMTVWISFHRWSMFTPITEMTWVGLDNYSGLFTDATRVQALGNTALYVLLSIVITVETEPAQALDPERSTASSEPMETVAPVPIPLSSCADPSRMTVRRWTVWRCRGRR
jgi:ABC-type polysaccharide transport system permease subunit